MRLVAPFRPAHTAITEAGGVSVRIVREGDRSVCEVDHPQAITALRRYGFAPEHRPVTVGALFDAVARSNAVRAWAVEQVQATVPALALVINAQEEPNRLVALSEAERNRDPSKPNGRASVIEAIGRRMARLA